MPLLLKSRPGWRAINRGTKLLLQLSLDSLRQTDETPIEPMRLPAPPYSPPSRPCVKIELVETIRDPPAERIPAIASISHADTPVMSRGINPVANYVGCCSTARCLESAGRVEINIPNRRRRGFSRSFRFARRVSEIQFTRCDSFETAQRLAAGCGARSGRRDHERC